MEKKYTVTKSQLKRLVRKGIGDDSLKELRDMHKSKMSESISNIDKEVEAFRKQRLGSLEKQFGKTPSPKFYPVLYDNGKLKISISDLYGKLAHIRSQYGSIEDKLASYIQSKVDTSKITPVRNQNSLKFQDFPLSDRGVDSCIAFIKTHYE